MFKIVLKCLNISLVKRERQRLDGSVRRRFSPVGKTANDARSIETKPSIRSTGERTHFCTMHVPGSVVVS